MKFIQRVTYQGSRKICRFGAKQFKITEDAIELSTLIRGSKVMCSTGDQQAR
jgi:hypothetical protein